MKTKDEILKEIREVIVGALNVNEDAITEDTKIADLSEDSIQLFELLLAFERKYATETTYEDVVKLHTVGDIVLHITNTFYAER